MTFDLDLAIDLADDNVERLVTTLHERGYRPRLTDSHEVVPRDTSSRGLPLDLAELLDASKREEWVAERNLIAFSLAHPERIMEEIDLLLVSMNDEPSRASRANVPKSSRVVTV
jgi:hypothetical protein